MDFTNIPTGLKVPTQIPLDDKRFALNEDTLAYLGVDDNLAFTYHDQLEVLCLAEKSIYIWREVQVGEENTGLVPLDFTYPTGLSNVYDINYSGKKYNFFLKEYITAENIINYVSTIVGPTGPQGPPGIDGIDGVSKLVDGVTTVVSGNGEDLNPYIVEMLNLQKVIDTFPYTLTSADDKYTIFVNNVASDVSIDVPNGLVDNFSCVFVQEGSGEVTIQSSGTPTVLKPATLQNIIKGQNYWAMIEKKTTTDNYFLLGSLKVL